MIAASVVRLARRACQNQANVFSKAIFDLLSNEYECSLLLNS